MKSGLRQYVAARMVRTARRFLRRTLLVFLLIGACGATVVAIVLYRDGMHSLPPVSVLSDVRLPATTQFFADDGSLLAEFYWERRHVLYPEEIPAVVRQAFVAAEDGDFYRHQGIDYVALARAFINNLDANRRVQGASTITQQLVKALLLSEEKTYGRKIREAILARRLERELSKDEILVLYLNHIYLGAGAYGVQAAAEEYFGKNVGDLTLAESAILAGLPKAPSRYSPFQNWPRARERQRYVLNRMEAEGFITTEEWQDALQQPISLSTPRTRVHAAPYFVDHVRLTLEQRYGTIALRALGLRVRTTLDLDMQRAAEDALRDGLESYASRHRLDRAALRNMNAGDRDVWLAAQSAATVRGGLILGETYDAVVTFFRPQSARVQIGSHAANLVRRDEKDHAFDELELNDLVTVRIVDTDGNWPSCVLDPSPPLEGALVALDPRTGHVRAMVGGYDYRRSQFNRVTSARRQPGSALKPFVYASALEHRFTPATVIFDEAIHFHDQAGGAVWSPNNYERRHFGRTTLAKALTFSRNVVTIKLAQRIGMNRLLRDLESYGFRDLPAGDLSIALGSAETSPLELAAAYGALANFGRQTEPAFIAEIRDADGQIIGHEPPDVVQVMEPTTAYQITRTLEDVIAWGTGRRAQLGRPAAGKTGTTNGPHDAWFVGYTPGLLASVWVGFDRHRELGKNETGGALAAPIWKSFMEVALGDVPPEEFTRPDGLKCFYVHNRTGRVANPGDPSQFMCFKEGTGPRPRMPRLEVEQAAVGRQQPARVGSNAPALPSNASAIEVVQPVL